MKLGFKKGIHTRSEDIDTPPGYYKDAQNMRATGTARRSEEGMGKISAIPDTFTQWGDCAIGDKTILVGTLNGKSIVGSLDVDDNWVVHIPARAGVDVLGIVGPTQVEGKKNWAGEDVIYFTTPNGARRINLSKPMPTDDVEFDKVTSLFLEYDLPKASYAGENSSGELKSGVYQFFVRLVTESGAPTPFGIQSSIIPVVKSSLTSNREAVTGDAPQSSTSKAIELNITNVDPAFKYVQIGVLTYTGLANTPVTTQTNLISTNGRTSLTYTYRGEPDNDQALPIEELIVTGVSYTSGEFLTQKDNSLLIAAPTEAAQPPINWFRVAANIVSRYTVKLIPFKEALKFTKAEEFQITEDSINSMDQGYKNPTTCALYKGYRRNEVYAFTMTPVFVGGVYGPTVHIPASHTTGTAATVDPSRNDGGLLGTYVSEELYPDDRYEGLEGSKLRFHKFPDAVQQPLIQGNVTTGNCNIRVLGVEFSNIVLDPSEIQYSNQIAGFIIGRVDRRGQETQLAQGIVRPNSFTQFNNNAEYGRSAGLGDGYCQWEADTTEGGTATQSKIKLPWDLSDFTFVAPDIIHKTYSTDIGSHIKQHSIYKADPYVAPFEFHGGSPGGTEFAHQCGFFKNIEGESTTPIDQTEVALQGDRLEVAPFGVVAAPQSSGGKLNYTHTLGSTTLTMASSMGFLWLKTEGGTPIKFLRDKNYYYYNHQRATNKSTESTHQFIEGPNFKAEFIVHTLIRKNTKQYGILDQQASMFTHYQEWEGFQGTCEFFNGDTFISKYGLTLYDEGPFPYPDNRDSVDARPNGIDRIKPNNSCGIVYFWLESDNNYDYRHYLESSVYSEENIADSGSMPFFPVYKQMYNTKSPFGLVSMHADNWVLPGYANQYNTQYSTQPTTKPYIITPLEDIVNKGSLVNRIIYSSQAVQGEKADGYQIFSPNNYYDVPQQFGELTDLYVNGELFASTAQVQWRLFFNTLTTQATSAGDVVLGTGGAFNRPAVPMTTVAGGYGGTSHWTHAVNTVYGRVFVDRMQGKFFIATDQLAVFSGDLKDTYRLTVKALEDDQILVGSEPLRERVFLKIGNTMWSYNLEQQVFVSKHTYFPRWMFSHGPYMYSNKIGGLGTSGIFKHSVGSDGLFYGIRQESFITLVANLETGMSKQFNIMELLTKRVDFSGNTIPFHTFNKMEVWNDERYTGLLKIVPHMSTFQEPGILEVLSNKVKDSFRIAFSRDIVIDPTKNIFDTSNNIQKQGDTIRVPWLPRMKGSYVLIKLITDNTQGTIYLFDVGVEVSENIR